MLRSIKSGALVAAVSAFALFVSTPASAQLKEVSIAADKDWEHDWTAMKFPTRIGTFERTRILQFEERETNIAANYFEPATDTILTVYIYRPGNPIAPIWFDRALIAIGVFGKEYGTVDLDDLKIGSFVPNGGTVESGQMAVTKVNGRMKSTAVALYQAGEWLVKLRISSEKLNVDEMETLTKETLAGLPKLPNVSTHPAYFVTQCASLAEFGNGTVFEADGDAATLGLTSAMMLGNFASMATQNHSAEAAKYCREGERARPYNIFRTEEAGSGYVIALGDGGASVEVLPLADTSPANGAPAEKDLHAIRSSTGLNTEYYMIFKGLPNPSQVSGAYQSAPIARTSRPLGDEEPEVELFVASGAPGE